MSLPELTMTEPAAAEFKAVVDMFSAATNPAAGYDASATAMQLGDGPSSSGGIAASIGAAIGGMFGGGPSSGEGGPAPE